jgi:hypothetical protein
VQIELDPNVVELGNPFTVRHVAIAAGFLTLMTLMMR